MRTMGFLQNILFEFLVALCLIRGLCHTSEALEQNASSFNPDGNNKSVVLPVKLTKVPNSVSFIRNNETTISGAPQRHMGREHVMVETNSSTKMIEDIKPVHENVEIPPRHDHAKSSVPKKGVNFNETTLVPKKPLVTEIDSDFINMTLIDNKEDQMTIISEDPSMVNDKNRADYIVPIVAVILSVPLVAIAISFIYKRGTDWWQHRNYKRMDFLIEGMYQN